MQKMIEMIERENVSPTWWGSMREMIDKGASLAQPNGMSVQEMIYKKRAVIDDKGLLSAWEKEKRKCCCRTL